MRFAQDSNSNINLIRSYAKGSLRINDAVYSGAVIVSTSDVVNHADIHDLDGVLGIEAGRILTLDPELILLGTGERQVFPPAQFGAQFLRAGIGFEVMDTGAACRTFNVLVAEQRRVVALLLI
jgi:uncharacterized protein